ncbi:MAG: hypothetical protein IKX50_08820 [Spirochaetia bacterium]|nr:hypothetical protein [Spirochaetia bacterium]MBR5017812.1 hypothetical protein [Spirochaetia bacterium]
MKAKWLFFILLTLCLVTFLASCDDGGSKSESGSDDEMGFKEGSDDPEPKSSITLDGDADPSLTFIAKIKNPKGGEFTIKKDGTAIWSEGTWEVTEWVSGSDGMPKKIKYKESKSWDGVALQNVDGAEKSMTLGETYTFISHFNHTIVFHGN